MSLKVAEATMLVATTIMIAGIEILRVGPPPKGTRQVGIFMLVSGVLLWLALIVLTQG